MKLRSLKSPWLRTCCWFCV